MGNSRLNVAILGASGRMGQALLSSLRDSDRLTLCGALVSPENRTLGEDAGRDMGWASGVRYSTDFSQVLSEADVVIDVSLPVITDQVIAACQDHRCPLLVGTTGLSSAHRQAMSSAAETIAILPAANFSIAMTLMLSMVQKTARTLGSDWRIDIQETHHRHKIDKPSGTALLLGDAVAVSRGRPLAEIVEYLEEKESRKTSESIAIRSIRAGEAAGQHTVTFADPVESLKFEHRAESRAAFARGALMAADWLSGQKPGLYRMEQILDNLGSERGHPLVS